MSLTDIGLYLQLAMLVFCIIMITLVLCDRWLPKWFCYHLGWHHRPVNKIGFDGCSFSGRCPRCGQKVLQDSSGAWFASANQTSDKE